MASTQQIIEKLLQEIGAEYDEAVVGQLNEYAFSFMKSLLLTAEETVTYYQRGERKSITEEDLKLALKIHENIQLECQDTIAMQKNAQQLQDIFANQKKNTGIVLPAKDTNMLQKNNYQLIIQQNQEVVKLCKIKTETPIIQEQQQDSKKSKLKIEFPDINQDF